MLNLSDFRGPYQICNVPRVLIRCLMNQQGLYCSHCFTFQVNPQQQTKNITYKPDSIVVLTILNSAQLTVIWRWMILLSFNTQLRML